MPSLGIRNVCVSGVFYRLKAETGQSIYNRTLHIRKSEKSVFRSQCGGNKATEVPSQGREGYPPDVSLQSTSAVFIVLAVTIVYISMKT